MVIIQDMKNGEVNRNVNGERRKPQGPHRVQTDICNDECRDRKT